MEEVEQLISKHVIFQKVLTLQDTKVMGSGSPEHGGGRVFKRGMVAVWWVYAQKRPRLGCSALQGPPEHLLSPRSLKGEWVWLLPGPSVSP